MRVVILTTFGLDEYLFDALRFGGSRRWPASTSTLRMAVPATCGPGRDVKTPGGNSVTTLVAGSFPTARRNFVPIFSIRAGEGIGMPRAGSSGRNPCAGQL